jgi:lipopolysaccharide transport system ATP-binding protein
MSSDIAIEVNDLSKCYQIYPSPRDRLKQFLLPLARRLFGLSRTNYYREFWALKNLNLKIKAGEVVGIIGRNGSGKSTLLQLICGTLSPTAGHIAAYGRIAALLELGSGFNPEFTGRENVYMNGAVLGLSREEIDRKFGAIESFAEIGDFIEQPVKVYSSGMMMRLAFAVAVNAEPQILVVDEALSVGDELFQRKCFSRLEALRNAGVTILFVSHSTDKVVELCDRAVLIDAGCLLAVGLPKQIVAMYQKLIYGSVENREAPPLELKSQFISAVAGESSAREGATLSSPNLSDSVDDFDYYDPAITSQSQVVYGSSDINIFGVEILSCDGRRVNVLMRGKKYIYRYRVRFSQNSTKVRFGMLIKTTSGFELGGCISGASKMFSTPFVEDGAVFLVQFEFVCRLNGGVYFMNAGVLGEVDRVESYIHRVVDVLAFRVKAESDWLGTGVIDFSGRPTVEVKNHAS